MADQFYNTIGSAGEDLAQREIKCSRQEKEVLNIFRRHPARSLTPLEVHELLGGDKWGDRNSCRRSITNLTTAGHLVKLGKDRMKNERNGAPNHTWELPENQKSLYLRPTQATLF